MNEITLTAAEITELLADARDRGGYERYLRRFVESGVLGENVMEALSKSADKRDSVYNSLNQNIKKLAADSNGSWPNLRLVKKTVEGEDGEKVDTLFIINQTAFEASQAA